MGELIKIREVSLKYDISARALKYYEDMGFLQSAKTDDYAYRVYDEAAIKRLEQILILRKMNISIKDIARIFAADSTEIVLEVLGKKVENIDDDVALLHELRGIILDFIKQINEFDFNKDADVKLLYEKANSIEIQIMNSDYTGNASNTNKLLKVTEKLEKMPDIKVIHLPQLKMARSGNTDLDKFDQWWSSVPLPATMRLSPCDFMWYNAKQDCFEWLFAIPEDLKETNGYDIFDFPGGLYAVATAIDSDDVGRVNALIHKWVDENEHFAVSNSENDPYERYDMGHIVTPEVFREKMGYHLMELFIPIVVINK